MLIFGEAVSNEGKAPATIKEAIKKKFRNLRVRPPRVAGIRMTFNKKSPTATDESVNFSRDLKLKTVHYNFEALIAWKVTSPRVMYEDLLQTP